MDVPHQIGRRARHRAGTSEAIAEPPVLRAGFANQRGKLVENPWPSIQDSEFPFGSPDAATRACFVAQEF